MNKTIKLSNGNSLTISTCTHRATYVLLPTIKLSSIRNDIVMYKYIAFVWLHKAFIVCLSRNVPFIYEAGFKVKTFKGKTHV